MLIIKKCVNNFVAFWITSVVFAVSVLYWTFPPSSPIVFSEVALGEATEVAFGFYAGDRVHCSEMGDAEDCLQPARYRSLGKSVLWLGNSQLHAINQPGPNAMPGSVTAAASLRDHDIELLTFSQPNASLSEHYILFEALSATYYFDLLLLPAVFDDTREQNIRSGIKALLDDPIIVTQLKKTAIGRDLVQQEITLEKSNMISLQERSETLITSLLDECCSWEALRNIARGETWLFLYQLRNYIFGINPSSVRRKIPAAYNKNLAAFYAILIAAREHGTQVIVYIPPLRSDAPRPYDPLEYTNFKNDIENLTVSSGGRFMDFEHLVPGPLWGTKDSTSVNGGQELDFMHFQEAGHVMLGQSAAAAVLENLK